MPMSWREALAVALKRPGVLQRKARLYLGNRWHQRRRVLWLAELTGVSERDINGFRGEIERDKEFLSAIRGTYRTHLRYFPMPTDFMVRHDGSTLFFHCVSRYALTRAIGPEKIVETGGTPGKSSAFLLRALERNGRGRLWTVDLPPVSAKAAEISGANDSHATLPQGLGPGWAIPASLKPFHTLILGDARCVLPGLLSDLGEIDMFIHDSDHSYEHMLFEFETAYPFVKSGGFIWSDDISGNSAWADFCGARDLVRCDFTTQGVTRKMAGPSRG